MCRQMEEDPKFKPWFMPTRRSNIPCYYKVDTESLCQMLVPYKQRIEARKKFNNRLEYNDWVWDKAINIDKLKKKFKGFSFHHEVSTDGVAASVLLSRPARRSLVMESKRRRVCQEAEGDEKLPRFMVGVDPGRKNVITAVDKEGRTLRYTSSQRTFESGLTRYRKVIEREKNKKGISQIEAKLSRLCFRTVNWETYKEYLLTKRDVDAETVPFYLQERWRAWKFRLYCKRRSSEDRLIEKLKKTFGPDCKLYYGDWSSKYQQRGCTPMPNKGLRLKLKKRFILQEVDEFRTSKICNGCLGELRRYTKRGGQLSYSRLFCPTCSSRTGRPVFVNRDVNAASNILLAGTAPCRPSVLSRSCSALSQVTAASQNVGDKSTSADVGREQNKLHVDAWRPSSGPTSISQEAERSCEGLDADMSLQSLKG